MEDHDLRWKLGGSCGLMGCHLCANNMCFIVWKSRFHIRAKEPNTSVICHYDDVKMDVVASQITSLTVVYSTVYSDTDQRKHQSSASLAFVRGIHRRPVNSPHKWPVTRKMYPFHDVIMRWVLSPAHCHPQNVFVSTHKIIIQIYNIVNTRWCSSKAQDIGVSMMQP